MWLEMNRNCYFIWQFDGGEHSGLVRKLVRQKANEMSKAISRQLNFHQFFTTAELEMRFRNDIFRPFTALISVACLISILFIREEKVHELNL